MSETTTTISSDPDNIEEVNKAIAMLAIRVSKLETDAPAIGKLRAKTFGRTWHELESLTHHPYSRPPFLVELASRNIIVTLPTANYYRCCKWGRHQFDTCTGGVAGKLEGATNFLRYGV